MYYPTLNEALASGRKDLTPFWPLGSNIAYGETVRHVVDSGLTYGKTGKPIYVVISVYRDERGMYEEPTTYSTR